MLDKHSIKLKNIIYIGISLKVLSKFDLNMRVGLRGKKSSFFLKIQVIILANCDSKTCMFCE